MVQILVIDDDPAVQLVLKRTLMQQGYAVEVAADGWDGLLQARKLQPELIICDWMMPHLDGLEVCRRLKQEMQLATFFILLTSRTSISDRVQGLDNGADDFLSKPIDLAELQARVRAALRIQQLTRELQRQKRQMEAELAEASEYVRSLLPRPLQTPIKVDSCFIPSRQLGGDCYDYAWLTPEHLMFFLLDVSGHGLGAALPSVSILNLLRSRSLGETDLLQPAQVLAALNRVFQMESHGDKYFTIWYGVYHQPSQQLRYATAGHPPALLVTATGVEALKTPGMPIGCFPEVEFVCHERQIEQSGQLYLFSDGIYELAQPDGSVWGLPRWVGFLEELHQTEPVTIAQILEQLRQVNPTGNFSDDVSLMQLTLP